MKRRLITTAALAISLAATTYAQRGGGGGYGGGGGHGGGHYGGYGGGGHGGGGHGGRSFARCNTGWMVQAQAERLQQGSFDLRRAVSNLPRPGRWMPLARPIGMATRKIVRSVDGFGGRGVCRDIQESVYDAKQAIRRMNRELERNGRGHYKVQIQDCLRDIYRKLRRFEYLAFQRSGFFSAGL